MPSDVRPTYAVAARSASPTCRGGATHVGPSPRTGRGDPVGGVRTWAPRLLILRRRTTTTAFEEGERIVLPGLVLSEWLRGPRVPRELEARARLLPADEAIPFGSDEAALAARLCREVQRGRGREIDLAIAA